MTTYNLADIFESLVDAIPDRTAIICGEERRTYKELEERANTLAHWFQEQGVGEGDHVGFYLFNSIEYVEGIFALLKIRAVPINVNYRYVASELRYIFDNADLVGLIHQQELEDTVQEAAWDRFRFRLVVSDDSQKEIKGTPYESAFAGGKTQRDFGPRKDDDMYIIYTGGTTGMPRGVMWPQRNLLFAGLQGGNPGGAPIESPDEVVKNIEGREPQIMCAAAPLIHGAAQFTLFIAMFTGGAIALMPGRSFNPDTLLRMVQREKINVIALVGDAMAQPIADALEKGNYDTSSLIALASAGAVLSQSIKDRLEKALPNTLLVNNYGASETGHQGTAIYEEGKDGKVQTKWMLDANTTVLDDDHQSVRPGSQVMGWLARKGYLPLGYYKDEAKTAATFIEIDGERWVIPGDRATVEEDGSIIFLGRGSVCINSGGEKIFPEEVEEALKAHKDIFDALVVGMPHERWGETVVAVLQPREGKTLDPKEIETHCRSLLANYKTPRRFLSVDKVERYPSGKPDYGWAKEVAKSMMENS